jgi:hypothetical protein
MRQGKQGDKREIYECPGPRIVNQAASIIDLMILIVV